MEKFTLPGMIYDESNKDYHANSAVSRSNLKLFSQRPSLFKKYMEGKLTHDELPAMAFGTAAHTLVLEGMDVFDGQYAVLPADYDGRTKAGKELMHEIMASGKIPLKPEDFDLLCEIHGSVFANPVAAALMKQGYPEISWRLHDNVFGIQCRSDWFCKAAPAFGIEDELLPEEGEPYALDFKTTQSLDEWVSNGWNNTIHKFGYHEQGEFYKLVINHILVGGGHRPIKKFFFVVTEKQEPRETAVFLIDDDTIGNARDLIIDEINRLRECFKTGIWPGFSQKIVTAEIPAHIRKSVSFEGLFHRGLLNEPGVELEK